MEDLREVEDRFGVTGSRSRSLEDGFLEVRDDLWARSLTLRFGVSGSRSRSRSLSFEYLEGMLNIEVGSSLLCGIRGCCS